MSPACSTGAERRIAACVARLATEGWTPAHLRLDDGVLEFARSAALVCDSYSRMNILVELGFAMPAQEWHIVLSEFWTMCDNISQYRRLLRRMLPAAGPVPGMMTPDELAAYDALPEWLTVYRGCGHHNMLGASWSLSRVMAARFPTLMRYRQACPLLVTATVPRHRVLALKLDRDEHEIITFAARRVSVEPIEAPPVAESAA